MQWGGGGGGGGGGGLITFEISDFFVVTEGII